MINILPRCKNCNCDFSEINNVDSELRLHQEISDLKFEIAKKDKHIMKLECAILNDAQNQHNYQKISLIQNRFQELEDKYSRLNAAYKQTVLVNQQLETKIICEVGKQIEEKESLVRNLFHEQDKADHYKNYYKMVEQENKMYKNDIELAVFLLKYKPIEYVAQKCKVNKLPQKIQDIIQESLENNNQNDASCNTNDMDPDAKPQMHLPMVTYPPTAMYLSMSKLSLDNVTNVEVDMSNKGINLEDDLEISMADLIAILEKRSQRYEYREMNSVGTMTDFLPEEIEPRKRSKVSNSLLLNKLAELTLNNEPKKALSRGEILCSSLFDKELSQIIRRVDFKNLHRSSDQSETRRRRQQLLQELRKTEFN